MSQPWPIEIKLLSGKRSLRVAFENGPSADLPAELLRCESPSAEVQGHSADERRLVPGKRDVAIVGIDPVGNYAVRLTFDDGHSTGIFTWANLAAFAADPGGQLRNYRDRLAEAGASFEPAGAG